MHSSVDLAGGVSLRQILPDGRFFRGNDIRVTSCSGDAGSCRDGDLYVALVGADRDGHEDVEVALRRGARAVLAERLLPVDVPVCVVPDTRVAFGRVCQKLAGEPGKALRLVGVTGTHGKTTTSLLIAGVLQAARHRVGLATTIGHSDSREVLSARRTTPGPPELADLLARMATHGCSHGVLEVSSCGLAERRLAGLGFDGVVLTNLRSEHIGFHGSVLNYRRAKMRLFSHLNPHGFAVLNADDAGSRLALSHLECPVITFGMREPAEIGAEILERHASEQTFLLTAGNEAVPVRTTMIGDHHVANCLAAAAVGMVLGLDLPTVARGLESVECLPGRLERIECGQPFSVFVDCADSAERLTVALKTVRRVTQGRLMCLVSSDSEERRDERPLVGRVVEKFADLAVLTGGPSRHGDPSGSIHDILDGYDRPARAHVIPTRKKAIPWLLDQARPGDSLLIAGSDRTADLGGYAVCSDSELARHWLYDAGRREVELSSKRARSRQKG